MGASAAPQLLKPVFAALGRNVSLFRLTGLVFIVSSVIFLAWRTRCLVGGLTNGQLRLPIPELVATSVLGSLLYYFWFIRSPSYNLLSVVGSYLFAGVFLWVLEAPLGTRSFSVRATCAGFLWAFCFLVKFPSGFALLALAGVAFLVWHRWSWRNVGLFAAHFAAGAVTALALYFIFAETPEAWISRVWGMVQFLQSPGFKSPPSSNIVRYLSQSSRGLVNALHDLWPAFVCVAIGFAASLIAADRNMAMRRITMGFLVALVLFNGLAIRAGFYGWQFTGQDLFYYYFLATALVLMTIAATALISSRFDNSGIRSTGSRQLSIVLVVLLTSPLASAFGTSNQITTNALLAMGSWFVAAMILATLLARQCLRNWIGPAFVLTLGAMACADVVSGAMHPYGIYTTIFEQTERTEVDPGGHSLKLDAATSAYVTDLRQLAKQAGITAPIGRSLLLRFTRLGIRDRRALPGSSLVLLGSPRC